MDGAETEVLREQETATPDVLGLLRLASNDLAGFLAAHLPGLHDNWWETQVLNRLSFQQQRRANEQGYERLEHLDFAALLRVLDQNWFELSSRLSLSREARTWVKELQAVRNRWAHLPAEGLPASDVYRDVDTLARLLNLVEAGQSTMEHVKAARAAAAAALTPSTSHAQVPTLTEVTAEGVASEPIMFSVGELVTLRSSPSEPLAVLEVLAGGTERRYKVFGSGSVATFYESQLQAHNEISQKTVAARSLRTHLTSLQLRSPATTHLLSMRTGRVNFVPYQYRPVLKLLRSDRPRLLIADEVGVGKTIEAGLILQELRARMDLESVLVLCPKPLVAERKWEAELKRFDEQFTALDGPMLRHCLRETELDGAWPEPYANAIVPFSLFDSDLLFGKQVRGRQQTGLLDLDPPPRFDLVIVDEAHHIRNPDTYLHEAVRYFCDNAQAVLLLTATPVQLGSEDLYTLLNVLRPDLVVDHASFHQMAAPNPHLNTAVQHLRAADKNWQRNALDSLDQAASTEWGRLFVRESPDFQQAYDQLTDDRLEDADRVSLIRTLEELYTFSPLVNRTRRRDIGEFTTRKPETVTVEYTSAQREVHDRLLDLIARILERKHGRQNVEFMMTTVQRQAASCLYGLVPFLDEMLVGRLDNFEILDAADGESDLGVDLIDEMRGEVEALLELARDLDPHDPKVEAFKHVLREKRERGNNKALVFSTFRHTLAYLAEHTESTGLRYGVVHGGVPDVERAELRRRFALPRDDFEALDVLLSSEVGCEGLDFQFCDLLVNYDLPWNPMRIEQRIGRIDRYGQLSESIAIINFVTAGTIDASIYERCLWRIGVFHHAVGGSEEILGEVTRELQGIATRFNLSPDDREARLQQLADNAVRQVQEEQALEAKQAELFGLRLPGQGWREDIEEASSRWLSPVAMQELVVTYLTDRVGEGEHLLGDKALKTLRLNKEARQRLLEDHKSHPQAKDALGRVWERWLKGGQPTLSITFEQEAAVENPAAMHLSPLHPLVRQAAASYVVREPVETSLIVNRTDLPAGEHHFAIYRWRHEGLKPDETLVPVADDSNVEAALLDVLLHAKDAVNTTPPDKVARDALEARHHRRWSDSRANHLAEHNELIEHRKQSLTASHRARCGVIEDQIARATNTKILRMKEGELVRAQADFTQRIKALEQATEAGDILAEPIVWGTLVIEGTVHGELPR